MTQQNTTAQGGKRLTTKGFAILPHEVSDTVPQAIKGAVRSVYPALHRRGWHSEQGCWASIKSLQEESGFGRPGVLAALRWLVSEGWVTKEDRPGCTSVYRVRIEDPQPPKQNPRRKLQGSPRQKTAGVPKQKTEGVPQQKTAYEQEPFNKNPLTREELEPPTPYGGLPPRGEQTQDSVRSIAHQHQQQPPPLASGTLAVVPQPAHPAPQDRNAPSAAKAPPKPRDPFASKSLSADLVPDDLLDCQQLLPEWWSVKAKGRTQVAFNRACSLLRRFTADERRQILETAIIGGHQGLYEPKENRSAGSRQPFAPKQSATSHAFAVASALIKQAEGRA